MISAEHIAEVCHEANRAYCRALGDLSQLPWDTAPDWQKSSAINGVLFRQKDPGAPPSASHENWLAQKRAEGWQYGPVKDPTTKTHPCFLPYDGLPPEQKRKDFLFCAIVMALTTPV